MELFMNQAPADSVQAYTRMQIETASKPRLVCMLHEQCVTLLRQSMHVDQPIRRQVFNKVQNLLVVLQRSLALTDATAQSLFHLYDYCYCLLEDESTTASERACTIIDTLRFLCGEIEWAQAIPPYEETGSYGKDYSLSSILGLAGGATASIIGSDHKGYEYSLFELDILATKGRIRIVDSGNKVEIYRPREDPCYAGFKALCLDVNHAWTKEKLRTGRS